MATPTASPDRDPTFEKIMAALPAPIREGLDRVLGMAETEGHAAALGFLQQLMRKNEQATGPDRIPDRLPFALELSLTGCKPFRHFIPGRGIWGPARFSSA